MWTLLTLLFLSMLDPSLAQGKIIGGEPAREYQFPYQVSIQYDFQHICGGTIYDKKTIVTAAHCCDGDEGNYRIQAGFTQLNSNDKQTKVNKCTYQFVVYAFLRRM